MEIWVATGNAGKVKEFKELLVGHQVFSIQDMKSYSAPPENGKTFEENATIKAKSFKAIKPGLWVLGEDSGIEVEGLGNMPGIFSARYAGDNARDVENTSKILKMLNIRSPGNRKAQFRSVIIAFDPQGVQYKFEGILKGEIAKDMRGTNGFGYDSIFVPEGSTQTLAEITVIEKNKISHRFQAVNQLIQKF
ncbi:MAG: RdgB/HAM1 family non-canonical purine NTP pyrophosphatase [Bdellovibrionota bacterium]